MLEHRLREFRLAGVALPPVRKARFKELMQQLTQLTAKFEENILDATNAWSHHVPNVSELAGLNPTIIERAREAAGAEGGYTLKLEQPVYVAVMTEAQSTQLRRIFYEALDHPRLRPVTAGCRLDNTAVMEDILRVRHELAQLVDFASYADYALANPHGENHGRVFAFLEQLRAASRPAAEQELCELGEFAGAQTRGVGLELLVRTTAAGTIFGVPVKSCGRTSCCRGYSRACFDVAQRLFGVRIVERAGVAVWHPDARYFEIQDPLGVPCGSFYLDPCARPNKRSGAWMDECVGRKSMSGPTELPVAYLVCNFLQAAPRGTRVADPR